MSVGSSAPKPVADAPPAATRGDSRSPRVVSLLPAGTDIVTALGADGTLVGVSHECPLPGAIAGVPRVTESALRAASVPGRAATAAAIDASVAERSRAGEPLFHLREHEIAALGPEVILTQALCDVCAVSETDVRALARRLDRPPSVVTLSASTLPGVFDDILAVADALGRRGAGEELVRSLRQRMERIHEVLSAARAPRPRVAVIEWTEPTYAAGHWVPEMVHRAGGSDVLAVPGQHSRQLLWEAVIEVAPDIVIIAPCGYTIERAAAEGEALARARPWLAGRIVWAVDAESMVSRPGPGLIGGIETFAAIFNPGLFAAPPRSRAVRIGGGQ